MTDPSSQPHASVQPPLHAGGSALRAGIVGMEDGRTASRRDPPSVRLVLRVLASDGRLTGADLCRVSGLPRRTVYQALRVLRERGEVHQRRSLQDTRQSYFWLAEPVAANEVAPEALRFDAPDPAQAEVSTS